MNHLIIENQVTVTVLRTLLKFSLGAKTKAFCVKLIRVLPVSDSWHSNQQIMVTEMYLLPLALFRDLFSIVEKRA